jgi:hypothetical protein
MLSAGLARFLPIGARAGEVEEASSRTGRKMMIESDLVTVLQGCN